MTRLITILIIVLISLTLFSQNTSQFRQLATEKSIPEIVKLTFKSNYPDALVYNWYITHIVYWYDDYSSPWYTNWYPQRPVVIYTFKEPSYYEVEFTTEPGETSRAIYNRYGYWFETRTKLSGLPANIVQSLKDSKYTDWKWSQHKEKIEAPGIPIPVYRLKLSKGLRSIIVRLNEAGDFIQEKEQDYIEENADGYQKMEKAPKNKVKN